MDRKLIFLDIDGTLTPAGSNVPPKSALEAIEKARQNGHLIFLCTGRNPGMMAPVLAYGFDGAVAAAGGYVFAGNDVLFDCPMDDDQLHTGLRLLKENGVFRTIESRDKTWGDEDLGDFLASAGDGNSELVRWRKALAESLNIRPMKEYDGSPIYKIVFMCLEAKQLEPVRQALEKDFNFVVRWRKALAESLNIRPMKEYDGSPIYKIVFMCLEAKQLEPARQALEKDFNFVVQDVAAHRCLNGELINRKFDKGRGVKIIADHFGAAMADTIGFGDSMNDLEMIEAVGVSVCMDNGSPLLKAKSDRVCPAVDEDGLAVAFRELGLI